MQHFNTFTCEARMAKQHGVKSLPTGNHVCSFIVVHDGPNEEQLWLNCSMFSNEKRAAFLGSLKPGQPIYLTGRLNPGTYNGKPSFKLDVYDFGLPPFNKNDTTKSGTNASSAPPVSSTSTSMETGPDAPQLDPLSNDDVPF